MLFQVLWGREEAVAVMDTDISVFTDTKRYLLAHCCLNLSSLSLPAPLSSPGCFSSTAQVLKHEPLIPAWQSQAPAPSPVDSSNPARSRALSQSPSQQRSGSFLRALHLASLSPPALFLLFSASFCHLRNVYRACTRCRFSKTS